MNAKLDLKCRADRAGLAQRRRSAFVSTWRCMRWLYFIAVFGSFRRWIFYASRENGEIGHETMLGHADSGGPGRGNGRFRQIPANSGVDFSFAEEKGRNLL